MGSPRLLASMLSCLFVLICAGSGGVAASDREDCTRLRQLGDFRRWSPTEGWVWDRLCRSQKQPSRANASNPAGEMDATHRSLTIDLACPPGRPKASCPPNPKISSRFLIDVLTDRRLQPGMPPWGLRLDNAVVTDAVNLSGMTIEHEVWLDSAVFHHPVQLTTTVFRKDISFEGSRFLAGLNLNAARLERNLFLQGGAQINTMLLMGGARILGQVQAANLQATGDVDFGGATIDGLVNLNASKLGNVRMVDLSVGHNLSIRSAEIDSIDLTQASVGRSLLLDSAVKGMKATRIDYFVAPSLSVGNMLNLNDAVLDCNSDRKPDKAFNKVPNNECLINLRHLRLRGQLLADGTTFCVAAPEKCRLSLAAAEIGSDAEFSGIQANGGVDFRQAHFGRNLKLGPLPSKEPPQAVSRYAGGMRLNGIRIAEDLSLQGSSITWLDLSDAVVQGELKLSDATPDRSGFTPGAEVHLGGAFVERFRFRKENWLSPGDGTQTRPLSPTVTGIERFAWNRLSGETTTQPETLKADYLAWLRANPKASLPAYLHFAGYLKSISLTDDARDVIYEGRRKAYGEQPLGPATLTGGLNYLITGFGQYPERSLIPIFALILIGTFVFRDTAKTIGKGICPVIYSFDMLIPLIRLNEADRDVMPAGAWPRAYYYFHKAAGWILAAVLGAALSGLVG